MNIYLTYNDAPSGIYNSQVIDVVKFLRSELNHKIQLVAFISLRGFFSQRKKIKSQLKDSVVIPMIPGVHRWRLNKFSLKILVLIFQPSYIIARSVLACNLALNARLSKTKVVYDGRGAIRAEWTEYNVVSDNRLLGEIEFLENRAINASNALLAVSNALVDYWKLLYRYDKKNYVVVPCTINSDFEKIKFDQDGITKARAELGYTVNDIVLIYSGSVSDWQSFAILNQFLEPLLNNDKNIKLLFLSKSNVEIDKILTQFPGQVKVMYCAPSQVPGILIAGDYGLLIREKSITNQVASPVKFAEYLSCGLKIIISKQLGDYTEFVRRTKCGYTVDGEFSPEHIRFEEKQRLRELSKDNFTKAVYKQQFIELLNSK